MIAKERPPALGWRVSSLGHVLGHAGRPPRRRRDFHRQYDLNPARCHLITVSGFTIAKAPSTFGAKRYKPANIRRSQHPERRPFRRLPPQHVKLMTQNRVFSLKRDPRPERSDQRQQN